MKVESNYKVGIYIRLSREDEKDGLSESITNQQSLLLQYIKENNYNLVDTYIDDGFSGTNFDRPEFNRLLNDIENSKINMVITKDMSRLGRDYIGTGNLIEKYFPMHNVRYIAVTDNIDTFLDSTNNDIAPFKAIMNDMYAKDISKKIRSSLRAKQKEGKYVGGRPPFGYDTDSQDKNHLIINEEQANVVKRIFDMSLSGLSHYKIALTLTKEKVKTPSEYYSFKWKNNYNLNYGIWNSKTIEDILTNRMYIGDLVQNKRKKINYKVKKIIKNNPKDYVIVEKTHDPIIDEHSFYEVQKRLPKNVGRIEKKENHLLDGLLYCGECGHRIGVTPRRKRDGKCYTICNYYRTYMKYKVCTTHSNNYDKLETIILDSIKQECLKYLDKNKIRKSINYENLELDNTIKTKNEIKNITNEIKKLNNSLDEAYIDKIKKTIDETQYIRIKEKIDDEKKLKEKKLNELNNLLANTKQIETKHKELDKFIDDFLSIENPTRELIVNLIDKVEIYQDKTINIKASFTDNTEN